MELAKEKKAFFVPFILPEGISFNICVLTQCIVYWIHFQNIQTFTSQKTLLHTLLLLVFKIVEEFLNEIVSIISSHSLNEQAISTRSSAPICNPCPDLKSLPRFVISPAPICNIYPYLKSHFPDLKSLPRFIIFLPRLEIP